VEVSFAELDGDPLGTLRRIYSALSLGDFASVQPAVEGYCAGLALSGFKKNAHRPLSPQLRRRVLQRWRQFYLDYGYPLPYGEDDEGRATPEPEEEAMQQPEQPQQPHEQRRRQQKQQQRPPKQQ
jgi:hypothetical protein